MMQFIHAVLILGGTADNRFRHAHSPWGRRDFHI
jgi:hypothetical protein